MRYGSDGVPILKNSEIEDIADIFLMEFSPDCLKTPQAVSPIELLDYMKNNLETEIVFQDLESLVQGGSRVLACTLLNENKMIFDENMATEDYQKHVFSFAVAHEVGHWKLHRSKKIKGISSKIMDTEKEIGSKKQLLTPRDWLEHQANVFARELLMPKWMFKHGLRIAQKNIGITRNLGEVYKHEELRDALLGLQKIFGVSKTTLEIRLKELGLFNPNSGRNGFVRLGDFRPNQPD